MQVLLAIFDLYRATGGGQTAYRAIVEHRPEDTFYYFARDEDETTVRPKNAIAIPFQAAFSQQPGSLARAGFDAHLNALYLECYNLAASARAHCGKITFDVVDVPDFHQYGVLIRPALAANGIGVGKVAVALHGVLTNSFLTNWPIDGGHDLLGRLRKSNCNIPFVYAMERMQYSTADLVYTCVGRPYQDRWRGYARRVITEFDPMVCVPQAPAPANAAAPGEPVDIVFVGRRERIKGPDLFLDLVAWAPRERIGKVIMVGPDAHNSKGEGSEQFLAPMVRNRDIDVEFHPHMTHQQLRTLFARRTLIVLPSRFDTLNFVALEALAQGCPVVVSNKAGVASYIPEKRPDVPIGVFDIDCAREGASVIADWVEHYDERRAALGESLARGALAPDFGSLRTIYEHADGGDARMKAMVNDLVATVKTFNPLASAPPAIVSKPPPPPAPSPAPTTGVEAVIYWWAIRLRPANLEVAIKRRAHTLVRVLKRPAGKGALAGDPSIALAAYAQTESERAENAADVRAAIRIMPERSAKDIEHKIAFLRKQCGERRVDRVSYFRELARLERRVGRPLVSATYQLRAIRWLGRDVFGDLPSAMFTLRDHGYRQEADALQAMYGPDPDRACERFLADRFEALRESPAKPWLKREDNRPTDKTPRLSIIVSMYNAENKLNLFLRMLAQDSLVRRGEAEILLIDSGSPTNEYRVYRDFIAKNPLPIFYGRSRERETIQAAWNRGIGEARGAYLTFLGVDEAIAPFASETLAARLDADPAVDWVVSDTLVTNANKQFVFDSDVMKYHRRDFQDWSQYLDCTYLNFVGCMYRKSIHERFGYYDESFGAAGDNEFKNRVLPHIKCAYVPKLLGIFNNFPEERTTQSPRAELEDLRAWYIHRTAAGMRYAFQKRPIEEAYALAAATLRYRKSYTGGHISTDFHLAQSIATVIAERSNEPKWQRLVRDVADIVREIEHVEFINPQVFATPILAGAAIGERVFASARRVKSFETGHAALYTSERPHYDIFNDNRYEQHCWCW